MSKLSTDSSELVSESFKTSLETANVMRQEIIKSLPENQRSIFTEGELDPSSNSELIFIWTCYADLRAAVRKL